MLGRTERPVAKRPQRCTCGVAHAAADVEGFGDLREDVLQPVDEVGASQLRDESHGNREERGVGLGDDDVAPSCHSPRVPRRRDVKGQIVDASTLQAQSAAPRGPDRSDVDALDALLRRKLGVCLIVTLSAGDDADVKAALGECKRHVGEKLSGGCVVWIEEAVEKNDPPSLLRHAFGLLRWLRLRSFRWIWSQQRWIVDLRSDGDLASWRRDDRRSGRSFVAGGRGRLLAGYRSRRSVDSIRARSRLVGLLGASLLSGRRRPRSLTFSCLLACNLEVVEPYRPRDKFL